MTPVDISLFFTGKKCNNDLEDEINKLEIKYNDLGEKKNQEVKEVQPILEEKPIKKENPIKKEKPIKTNKTVEVVKNVELVKTNETVEAKKERISGMNFLNKLDWNFYKKEAEKELIHLEELKNIFENQITEINTTKWRDLTEEKYKILIRKQNILLNKLDGYIPDIKKQLEGFINLNENMRQGNICGLYNIRKEIKEHLQV
jgi:hypothetical protein